jgi:DNA-binding NtrC family response regulator
MVESAQVVIVVDRESAVHEVVAKAVGAECAVLGATGAELALKLAERRAPAIALIEASSNEDDGVTLVASLRERSPHMQAIFVCAKDVGTPPRLAALGAILHKPIDPTQLRAVVLECLKLRDISEGVDRLHAPGPGGRSSSDMRRSAPTKRERPR